MHTIVDKYVPVPYDERSDDEQIIRIHYNGDFSGDARIIWLDDQEEHERAVPARDLLAGRVTDVPMHVACRAVAIFVRQYVTERLRSHADDIEDELYRADQARAIRKLSETGLRASIPLEVAEDDAETISRLDDLIAMIRSADAEES